MVAIVTRAGKGSPLTNAEVDSNFTNLNNGKLETSNNLSDLADASAARTNLGLGSLATLNSITSLMVTGALGYTPANKAGDTFTGDVVFNGKVAVGTSITANTNYRFGRGISGGVSSSAFVQNGNVQSDVTTTAVSFNSQANTVAAAFTLTNYFHYFAQQGVIGAGSAITAVTGFYADNTLVGSTNTYGFRGAVGSGSGRWNLYMDGTASNFMAGATIFGNALGFGAVGSPSYGSANQVLTSQGSSSAPSWQGLRTVNGNSILGTGDIVIAGGVTSFNTRTGAVTLSSSDVTTALGYTPLSAGGGTLTGALTLQSSAPILNFFESDQTLPAGRRRLVLDGNSFSLRRNTAAAGDFSTEVNDVVVDSSSNFTAGGNVTAYSDERLKADWCDLPTDFVERLAQIKHGKYTRIDTGDRQVGASAQQWQELLPEAVMTASDDFKTLSLAYGNAAVVSAIQLAQRVVSLTARLHALEQKMGA